MSPRSWTIRVNDMLRAIDDSRSVVQGKNFLDFQKDRTLVLATLACVQIIGEASNHIPDDIKNRYPAVPWNEIRGMRNRITHEYFEVDINLLWETVQTDLPTLKPELQKMSGIN